MYELELIASDADLVNSDVDLRSADEVRLFYGSLLGQSSVSALRFVECGEAFGSFGLFDEALESFGRAVAKDGGCLRAYLARGELYFELAVCAQSDEERKVLGRKAVEDFRKALLLSLGLSDVIWSLGVALILIEEPESAKSLAKNALMKGSVAGASVRCDFLYLLGLAQVFARDREAAEQAFEALMEVDGEVSTAWFGRIVCSLVLSRGTRVDDFLRELEPLDSALFKAARSLEQSGCASFVNVVRALSDVGVTVKKRK